MNLFPCPFCHSAAVKVTGAGRHFSHYRCTTCEEVWTAQTPAPSAAFGRAVAHSHLEPDALVGPLAPATSRKVLLH